MMARCAGLVILGPLLASLGFLPPRNGTEMEPLPDPLPLRRVLISAERVPAELARARQGVLIQLSRKELEARVQRAARAGAVLKNPPRLVEARYRATLVDTALVGTGQWQVLNPAPAGGILPLSPLNLALQKVRVQKVPADPAQAVLGDLDGKSLGLLVEQPGEHVAFLDWTARAEPEGGGLRFSLQVPAAVVATLELNLPADRVVTAGAEACLLAGPLPAETPERQTWRIDFANRSQVDFVVSPGQGAGPAPHRALAQLENRQDLGPDLVRAELRLKLEVPPPGVRDLVVECDPVLRPYEVDVTNLETWSVRPPRPFGGARVLTVRLREPLRGGPLRIRCLAPLPADRTWTCPTARLMGALDRGESLRLRVPAEMHLEGWQPGAFRFTENPGDQEGWLLTLTRHRLTAGGTSDRPRAQVRRQEPDIRSRQLTWWQLGTSGASLTVQVTYDVVRGRLFALPVQLPAGWRVEQVKLAPAAALLRSWTVLRENGSSRLLVDLQDAVGPARLNLFGQVSGAAPAQPALQLTVRLEPEQPGRAVVAGRPLPIPQVVPLNTQLREAGLALSVDALYEAQVDTTAVAGAPEEQGPWGRQPPDYFLNARGQEVTGTVRLRPRQASVQARCTSEVVIASGRAVLRARLALQPGVGHPQAIDFALTAPAAGPGTWKTRRGTNQVRDLQPLSSLEVSFWSALLGIRSPLEATGWLATQPARGRWYRITLARPLREPVVLEATFELAGQAVGAQPGERRWHVPLPVVLNADALDGDVALYVGGTELVRVELSGLREVPGTAHRQATRPWRAYRYSHLPLTLTLAGRVPAADRSAEATADSACLTTFVDQGGRLLHHYQVRVWSWGQQTLPVRLPTGARPLAAKVDGHWVARLPAGTPRDGAEVIALPAGAAPLHRFEIVFETDSSPWQLWACLRAPARDDTPGAGPFHPWEPELPVRPISFQHIWKLAAGLRPLADSRYQPRSGQRATPAEPDLRPRPGWAWPLASVTGPAPSPWLEPQQDGMAAATEALQKALVARREIRLGDLLDQVFFGARTGPGVAVVVDAWALKEAGWGPATPLTHRPATPPKVRRGDSADSWEGLGLAFRPCRPALLLTTTRRLVQNPSSGGRWGQAAADSAPVSAQLAPVVAQAVANGHDPSAQFWSLADWLAGKDRGPDLTFAGWPAGILPANQAGDWTEWEARAGDGPEGAFLVARTDLLPGLGLGLALLLVLANWSLRRSPLRSRLGLLAVCVALGGLGIWWLPAALQPLVWWPALAGVGFAAAWYLSAIGRSLRPRKAASGAVAAALALGLTAGLPGQTSAPAPATVLILPGPREAPEEQTVLVPPELLDRLQALSRQADLRHPVLTAAWYDGTVTGLSADLKAELRVFSPVDGPATLTLPLGGSVQLKDALLDGAAAHLRYVKTALPQPQEGYALEVKERGPHTLLLRFSVVVTAKSEDRDLAFAIPELAQSRLTLDLPPGAHDSQTVAHRGAQRVRAAAGPGGGPSGSRLEVELGRVPSLHVRWREQPDRPQPPALVVREGYLWTIQPDAGSLSAVLQYTVSQGAVTSFAVDIPPDLEVVSAAVVRSPGEGTDDSGPRLKQWILSGAGRTRQLLLTLQRPVTTGVQVILELVPRQPRGPVVTLPLPVPTGARPAEGDGKESFLAYRVDGLSAQVRQSLRINGHEDRQPFIDYWRSARMGDPGPQTHLYTFRRTSGPPVLRLAVQPPLRAAPTQSVTWTVGRHRADFVLTARLTSPETDLMVVEWDLPVPVVLGEVSGAEVRSWSQLGSRLQVWLDHPVASATIQLTGWQPLDKPRPTGPARKLPPDAVALCTLSPLRLVSTPPATTYLRVVGGEDLALEPQRRTNLWPLPDTRTTGGSWDYVTEQESYAAVFLTRTSQAKLEVQGLTLAEVLDRRLTFHTVLDLEPRPGESGTLAVRLRHWEGEEARLEAPGAVQRFERARDDGSQVWTVTLPPGATGRSQLHLTGSRPLKPGAEVLMPDVSVGGGAHLRSWVAVAGRELRPDEVRGLKPVSDPLPALRRWPAEAERVRRAGSAWEVQSPRWTLRLLAPSLAGGAPPVQVFLADQSAALVDGRRWGHQASYWLFHEAGMDLTVTLPDRARLVSVALDGAEITPLQPQPNRLWLPLAGSPGAHRLRLTWMFEEGAEPFDRPILGGVKLEGVAETAALWTVHVPRGYALTSPANGVEPGSAAGQDLHRAEAQLNLSAVLADHLQKGSSDIFRPQLVAAQESFYRYCRWADHRAAGASAVEDYRQRLEADNQQLARTHDFEALRARAERQVREHPVPPEPSSGMSPARETDRAALGRDDLLPQLGTPTYWLAPTPALAPEVTLTPLRQEQVRRALLGSVLLVLLLSAAWVISFFPRLVGWILSFWPEQLVGLACLAGWFWGLTAVVWLIGLTGVVGRLLLLAGWLFQRFRRPQPVPAPEGTGLHST